MCPCSILSVQILQLQYRLVKKTTIIATVNDDTKEGTTKSIGEHLWREK